MENVVLYEVSERVAYITLNRPDKRNALNDEIVEALHEAFCRAEADGQVKVVVLRAKGSVFCAGADLAYLQQLQKNNYEENLADSSRLKELFHKIYTLKKVVIAQIQGHAIAGGCGLVTVCDVAFAVPEAKFGYTEVKIGFIPAIVSLFLLRKIGEGRAKELLLSGRLIDAEEALSIGLVHRLVEADCLEAEVKAYAAQLCVQNSASSMELSKRIIAEIQERTLEQGLQYAAQMNAMARETEDCRRGIAAFLEKKPLEW
jgi:methylglutaconyl-CoA hydratase